MHRQTHRLLVAALTWMLAACGSSRKPPRIERPLASPEPTTEASTPPPHGPPPVDREALGPAEETALPVHLLPSRDRRAALVVHDAPGRRRSYLRRIDAEGLGPLRVLDGRRVAALVELPEGPRVISSDGERLCVEPATAEAPTCHRGTGRHALALAEERLVILEQRLDVPEEGRGPSKRRPGDRDDDEDPDTEVRLRPLTADGEDDGEPIDTGLRFRRPLIGMEVIDAIGTPDGAAVLFSEHRKPKRVGRRKVKRARLRLARLDEDGQLVEGSTRTVLSGERRYGYIDGHHRQRLFRHGGELLVVGRHVDRTGKRQVTSFEAHRPDGHAVTGPDAVFGTDPARLAREKALSDEELERLTALWELAPRRVVGQPGSDAGRVAWVGETGWFLSGGALHRSDEAEPVAAIEAERLRLRWARLRADGSGVARTSSGLVRIGADGAIEPLDATAPSAIVGAPTFVGDGLWVIARTGDRSGGRAVRVLPTRLEGPAVTPDQVAIAGGDSHGLLIRRHGPRLSVARLAASGSVEALSAFASPFSGDFSAMRTGEGAVVVGERDGRTVGFGLDHAGRGTAVHELADRPPERLATRPGGALLWTRASVIWLDDAARPLARAPRPRAGASAPCVDGAPLPTAVPRAEPGELAPLPAIADACALTPPVIDGRHVRWLGSRVEGADAVAERLDLELPTAERAPGDGSPSPRSGEPEHPDETAPTAPPCPPEMVSVADAFCIDRYEARLADGSGALLSPDYPPSPTLVSTMFDAWAFGRFYEGDLHARAVPLPPLGRSPSDAPRYLARSERGLDPSGFLSGYTARKACEAAGKRLCSHEEWVRACRGQAQTKFPWGDDYARGRCNVHRLTHPASILHDNAAIGHLDPRLNRVIAADGPTRHRTGASPACASRWGDDAVYDMVGNLDEWVDDDGGAFAGGFYARTTKQGCDALIGVHPRRYLDYSLGVRCCKAPRGHR